MGEEQSSSLVLIFPANGAGQYSQKGEVNVMGEEKKLGPFSLIALVVGSMIGGCI
ncbi:hypothetical protein P7H21_01445 [Paenibacillus larvae]|nr:hypothetical protein [Paenibacillus larvae]MDT2302973.1 hypothetical protein [Paenibacillus larvae]